MQKNKQQVRTTSIRTLLSHMIHLLFVSVLLMGASSCKVYNMYSGKTKTAWPAALPQNAPEHRIAPGDKITVSVHGHDDLSVGSLFSIYNSNESYGRWLSIDENGKTIVPGIGLTKLSNLTAKEASDYIEVQHSAKINDPEVLVKVLNRQVHVLGEVKTPGSITLDREDHTLAEMLSKCNGTEAYADLRKVQLIRNGKIYELDMTSKKADPDLQVYAGDLITVPSRKGKMLDKKSPTLIPFASSLTALALIASIAISLNSK